MMRGNKNALFNGRMEIHNYQRRLEYWQKRIGKEKHADKALAFISHLKTKGLSYGRVCAYASRVPKLQRTLAYVSQRSSNFVASATKLQGCLMERYNRVSIFIQESIYQIQ